MKFGESSFDSILMVDHLFSGLPLSRVSASVFRMATQIRTYNGES